MKKYLCLLPVLLLSAVLRGEDAAAPEDGAKTLASKITAVTVYADRARVTRSAAVDLTGEATRFALRALPGWLDEGSVRVSLNPPAAGQLLDVEVKKTFLARTNNEEVRKAEAAAREISDQLAGLSLERGVLEEQAKQVEAIRVFSLDKLPRDAATREVKVGEYGQVVEFVGDSLRKLARAKHELELKERELQPELAARQKAAAELRQRAQLEQRSIIVTLKAPAAARAELNFAYLLPGAAWEPAHELRADAGGKTVALASYAVVRQTTGEDWSGVALALSTQSTTSMLRLPELETLLVGESHPIAQAVNVTRETFSDAKKKFAAQFEDYNQMANPPLVQTFIQYNKKEILYLGETMSRVFEELQLRGTTTHFAATIASTIRTDGNAVRVPIGTMELAAEQRVLAAPEVSLNAARTVDLVNTGRQPILPGKVALFVEGAFLGATETGFVSQGESFSVFLGVVDRIKLARSTDLKHSSYSSDGKRTRIQAAFVVKVENLGDQPTEVCLADRVPVSEMEDVRVRNIKVLPEVRPDDKGLLRWELALGAKEEREFHVEYTLEYPAGFLNRFAQSEVNITRTMSAGRAVGAEKDASKELPEDISEESKDKLRIVDPKTRLYMELENLEKQLKK